MRETRRIVAEWVRTTGASAAFLVDSVGQPFASVGHIDFEVPEGLGRFTNRQAEDAVLAALVGQRPPSSGCRVDSIGGLALMVTLFEATRGRAIPPSEPTTAALERTWESVLGSQRRSGPGS